jgi:hypothetical protein
MRLVELLPRWLTPRVESEPYDPPQDDSPQGDVAEIEASSFRGPKPPADLQEARRAAKERYQLIAETMKREAGVLRHYTHKSISGLAWIGSGKILAPNGITRRQLYVLAHECGHIVLHSSPRTWNKPGHIKEHEAETYAHRAFERYGLEVPEKSAQWARAFVGQWIMKDRTAGISVCPMAEAFASGRRAPDEPLPAVDGHPKHDFSKMIAKHTAKSLRIAARQDAIDLEPIPEQKSVAPSDPPNACGTCVYLRNRPTAYTDYQCGAYLKDISVARYHDRLCNDGVGWRPRPPGFWSRLLNRFR